MKFITSGAPTRKGLSRGLVYHCDKCPHPHGEEVLFWMGDFEEGEYGDLVGEVRRLKKLGSIYILSWLAMQGRIAICKIPWPFLPYFAWIFLYFIVFSSTSIPLSVETTWWSCCRSHSHCCCCFCYCCCCCFLLQLFLLLLLLLLILLFLLLLFVVVATSVVFADAAVDYSASFVAAATVVADYDTFSIVGHPAREKGSQTPSPLFTVTHWCHWGPGPTSLAPLFLSILLVEAVSPGSCRGMHLTCAPRHHRTSSGVFVLQQWRGWSGLGKSLYLGCSWSICGTLSLLGWSTRWQCPLSSSPI